MGIHIKLPVGTQMDTFLFITVENTMISNVTQQHIKQS
jgi:hypothetical protein